MIQSRGEDERGQRARNEGRLSGVDNHPGCWWLAARWENLLLSCTLCNQPPDKGTKFPVAEEGESGVSTEQEAGEVPLLLDPCVDHPENHLKIRGR